MPDPTTPWEHRRVARTIRVELSNHQWRTLERFFVATRGRTAGTHGDLNFRRLGSMLFEGVALVADEEYGSGAEFADAFTDAMRDVLFAHGYVDEGCRADPPDEPTAWFHCLKCGRDAQLIVDPDFPDEEPDCPWHDGSYPMERIGKRPRAVECACGHTTRGDGYPCVAGECPALQR